MPRFFAEIFSIVIDGLCRVEISSGINAMGEREKTLSVMKIDAIDENDDEFPSSSLLRQCAIA